MLRCMQILVLVLFLAGCSAKQPTAYQVGEKSFENEDFLILSAFEMQNIGNYKGAIEIYRELFRRSAKINYLVEALKASFSYKDVEITGQLLEEALLKAPSNSEIRRLEIGFLLKQERYSEAKKRALELLTKDKSTINLKIVGSIYLIEKSYELALKYFESAYIMDSDESSLLHIVDILYNYLGKKNDAIALLETHIRVQGCEVDSCFKLIEIYGKQRNIDGVISTYKKLYFRFKDERYAKKVVELLMYKKDKRSALKFLEKSGYNQEMLLDLYASLRDYKNAYIVARRLFEKSGDVNYLGKMAIYKYELNEDNLNDDILKSIMGKFERVVAKLHDPLYLNYYGYLLIDHNIDIEKGIGLIQEALLKEPNSPYYLDSLAWGLYKLGKCKEAKEVMDRIGKNITEKEILEHIRKIEECIAEDDIR